MVPETSREEVIDGRRIHAAPAEYQHADPQCRVDYLISAHAKPGYVGSSDLLTRVAGDSDFASHACIRRDGSDSAIGQRHLEELAFEVIHPRGREASIRLLARLLERRFGPLPKTARTRLGAATDAELEALGDAVLDAESLDAVFRSR